MIGSDRCGVDRASLDVIHGFEVDHVEFVDDGLRAIVGDVVRVGFERIAVVLLISVCGHGL